MEMTKNGRLAPHQKTKNFPYLMIFGQKAPENDQNLWFLKKNLLFEKIWKLMAFDQNSFTITHETEKYDEKIESFYRKLYDIAEP